MRSLVVLKELWLAATQRFTGYIPDDFAEVEMSIKGSHYGPVEFKSTKEIPRLDGSESQSGKGQYRNHEQYLVCCRANFHAYGLSNKDDGDCILARRRTSDMRADDLIKNRLFLFDDIYTYIQDFVAAIFLNEFKCLAYMRAFDWLEAEYLANGFIFNYKFSTMELYPHAVITNIVLHTFHKPLPGIQADFERFMNTVNSGDAPIRYIMHSTAAVREGKCRLSSCENKDIRIYNALIKSLSTKWNRLEAYLDLYNYTSSLVGLQGFSKTCDSAGLSSRMCMCQNSDGIHFERICNYGAFMTQWDFNWMTSLGVFNTI